jgi:hypothetical protein
MSLIPLESDLETQKFEFSALDLVGSYILEFFLCRKFACEFSVLKIDSEVRHRGRNDVSPWRGIEIPEARS